MKRLAVKIMFLGVVGVTTLQGAEKEEYKDVVVPLVAPSIQVKLKKLASCARDRVNRNNYENVEALIRRYFGPTVNELKDDVSPTKQGSSLLQRLLYQEAEEVFEAARRGEKNVSLKKLEGIIWSLSNHCVINKLSLVRYLNSKNANEDTLLHAVMHYYVSAPDAIQEPYASELCRGILSLVSILALSRADFNVYDKQLVSPLAALLVYSKALNDDETYQKVMLIRKDLTDSPSSKTRTITTQQSSSEECIPSLVKRLLVLHVIQPDDELRNAVIREICRPLTYNHGKESANIRYINFLLLNKAKMAMDREEFLALLGRRHAPRAIAALITNVDSNNSSLRQFLVSTIHQERAQDLVARLKDNVRRQCAGPLKNADDEQWVKMAYFFGMPADRDSKDEPVKTTVMVQSPLCIVENARRKFTASRSSRPKSPSCKSDSE